MALTKKDIVERIHDEIGFIRNKSLDVTETLLEIIKSRLAAGEDVLVSGFGKFCIKEKGQRRGRNPATGDSMMLPARRVVTFQWSAKLRDKLNRK